MQIEELLKTIDDNCKLLLIVGKPGSGKSKMVEDYSASTGIPILDLNTVIGDEPKKDKIEKLISGFFKTYKYDVILIDKKQILYSKNSEVDVLNFLIQVSKYKPVVATWNGYVNKDELHHIRDKQEIIYPISNEFKCIKI